MIYSTKVYLDVEDTNIQKALCLPLEIYGAELEVRFKRFYSSDVEYYVIEMTEIRVLSLEANKENKLVIFNITDKQSELIKDFFDKDLLESKCWDFWDKIDTDWIEYRAALLWEEKQLGVI